MPRSRHLLLLVIVFFIVGMVFLFKPSHLSDDEGLSEPFSRPPLQSESFPFVVLVYGKTQDLGLKSFVSALEQEYNNYRIQYIYEGEIPNSINEAFETLGKGKIVEFIPQKGKLLQAFYLTLLAYEAEENEIALLLDGDEWLAHPFVLESLSAEYEKKNTWMTLSSHFQFPDFTKKYCSRFFPEKMVHKRNYRNKWNKEEPFYFLNSFYISLFKSIKLQDFLYKGKFINEGHFALALPLLEKAGKNTAFLNKIHSLHQRKSLSDAHLKARKALRQMAQHKTKEMLPTPKLKLDKADVLIFSFDHPMVLYSCLESLRDNVKGWNRISVLYRASNQEMQDAYLSLSKMFPLVKFIMQGNTPHKDFKPLTLSAIREGESDYILFATDECIACDAINLSPHIKELRATNAQGVFFSLGETITYGKPFLETLNQNLYAFSFNEGKWEWSFPCTIRYGLFAKKRLLPLFEKMKFDTPHSLEVHWGKVISHKKIGLCPRTPLAISLEIIPTYSSKQLLTLFEEEKKLDLAKLPSLATETTKYHYVPSFVERKIH